MRRKDDPKELRSVTLLVTPDDAARLDLGQNKGTLSLALRNPEDTATAAVDATTLAELRRGNGGFSVPLMQDEQQTGSNAPPVQTVEPAALVTAEPAVAEAEAAPVIKSGQPAVLPPIRTLPRLLRDRKKPSA